jgi:hypothetical protein
MIGKILFSSCVAITAAVLPSAAQRSAPVRCLALGVGAWTPSLPEAIWSSSRRLSLTSVSADQLADFAGRRGWRVAQFLPDEPRAGAPSPAPAYDTPWVWLAPAFDSLLLTRPAMLSEGMEVRGTWVADTLRGRAHAFSDAIDMVNGAARSPRANAYGVRFSCKDSTAAAIAVATVERLRCTDQPDAALGAREDSVWTVELSRPAQEH